MVLLVMATEMGLTSAMVYARHAEIIEEQEMGAMDAPMHDTT
jgi:hypothetical protein